MSTPVYNDHLHQSRNNLKFLEFVNNHTTQYHDWEVTSCYCVAVHLVNAYLSLYESQIWRHYEVMELLKQFRNQAFIPDTFFRAYYKLRHLSRRSRYLVNERNANTASVVAYYIDENHLKKALEYLHTLIAFFKERYGTQLEKIRINCSSINTTALCYCETMN